VAAQRACAAAKAELARQGENEPALLREVAEHLIEAGQPEAAAEEAIEAGALSRQHGHAEAGLQCLALARACLDRLAVPSLRLAARLEVAFAEAELHAGRMDAASAAARAAVVAGRASGDAAALAKSLVAEGDVLRRIGATDAAIERLLEACDLARTGVLPEPLGRACHSLGQINYARGDLALAEGLARTAVIAGRESGDTFVALMAGLLVRAVALARGDLESALEGMDADRAAAEALGVPLLIAELDRHLGEVAIVRGEAERAREHFARQAGVLELLGDPHLTAHGQLATSLGFLEMGRGADADVAAARAEGIAEELGARTLRRDAAVLRAHAAALQEDWTRVEVHMARVLSAPELEGMDLLVARSLSRVGRLSIAGGQAVLARLAFQRALVHLRRLGSPEVQAIETLLGADALTDATTNRVV